MQWKSQINYQDPRTRTYLGSPSIVRLPSGALLASNDYFGDFPDEHFHLTGLFRSQDNGETWQHVTHLSSTFWSNLFLHRGKLYLMGTSRKFGDIIIRRSDDEGFTWTAPVDENSGLLYTGGKGMTPPNYHCAPMPVVEYDGRLYRAYEDMDPPVRPIGFKSFVVSCPADADLLLAENWTMSNQVVYDQDADSPDWGGEAGVGWLEGNVVRGPNGLVNLIRLTTFPVWDKAAMLTISDGGKKTSFDSSGFVELPGGSHKFTVRRDEVTGLYVTLVNKGEDPEQHVLREKLSVFASEDLRNWFHVKTLMEDDLIEDVELSRKKTGFQYADWQFDGDDLIYVVRTSYDGAHTFHDSNLIVYGVLNDFRDKVEEKRKIYL
ncbi:sialidase family protein [Paenibacillus sp. HB172176]|uniref:sialidase family protein n=1 Tax=Paenibacillus sp. HB172176 TaxID=2493690 RepID=UPI0014387C9B|nr:sialidase family protein [Paenibacillus sp. HB172176]